MTEMASGTAVGRILIVESDDSISGLLRISLGSEGYDVISEKTVNDIDMARLKDTDLVIADATGQGYNGLDLLRDIKGNQATAHVSVLLYSSGHNENIAIEALDKGADDYVQKPFSPRELLARIRAVFRRRHAPAIKTGAEKTKRS